MERVCAAAAAAVGAHVVGKQAVTTVFFALAYIPAALEGVAQSLVGVDCSIGRVEPVGLVGLVGLAVEGGEVRPACLGPLECYTLMEPVVCTRSRWRLGGLG